MLISIHVSIVFFWFSIAFAFITFTIMAYVFYRILNSAEFKCIQIYRLIVLNGVTNILTFYTYIFAIHLTALPGMDGYFTFLNDHHLTVFAAFTTFASAGMQVTSLMLVSINRLISMLMPSKLNALIFFKVSCICILLPIVPSCLIFFGNCEYIRMEISANQRVFYKPSLKEMNLLAPWLLYQIVVALISNFSNILLTYQLIKVRRQELLAAQRRIHVVVAKVEQGLIGSIVCTSFFQLLILIFLISTSIFGILDLVPFFSTLIALYTGSPFWLTIIFVPSVRRCVFPSSSNLISLFCNRQQIRKSSSSSATMTSFWPLLCRIVEGTLGVILNVVAIAVLWNRKMRVGWSTYRIGITVLALHGVLMSALGGATTLCHIFHGENYILLYYGVNCFLPQIANDVIMYILFIVVIGLWELIPAGCILQYLALCRSHYSNRKRLFIVYAVCAALAASSMPFYTYFYATPSQIERFEQLTREIHNLSDDDVSPARFALFAIIPSYCIAYFIFILCCVSIYRTINAFGIQLSQRTLAMQRTFLGMLITQGWLPLAVLSIPVGCFVTSLLTGFAMDLLTLIFTFSLWLVPSVQGVVSLTYVLRMKSSTSENTINSRSRTSAVVIRESAR